MILADNSLVRRTLVNAILAGILAKDANGASITYILPRKGGGDDGHGGDGPDDPDSPTNNPSSPTTPTLTSTPTQNGTTLSTSSTSTTSISSTSSSSTTMPSATTSSSASINAHVNHDRLSKGGIVGATIGSVVVASLALMVIARYIQRTRKARKRPKGFVPSSSFYTPPPPPHTTEMSQTDSAPPLIASAVGLSRLLYPVSALLSSSHQPSMVPADRSTLASASPSPGTPHTVSTSLGSGTSSPPGPRSNNGSEADSSMFLLTEPLQSPYSPVATSSGSSSPEQKFSSVNHGLLAVSNGGEPSSPSTAGSSSLHRDMTSFQKSLEANHKEHMDNNNDALIDAVDPPPKYDA